MVFCAAPYNLSSNNHFIVKKWRIKFSSESFKRWKLKYIYFFPTNRRSKQMASKRRRNWSELFTNSMAQEKQNKFRNDCSTMFSAMSPLANTYISSRVWWPVRWGEKRVNMVMEGFKSFPRLRKSVIGKKSQRMDWRREKWFNCSVEWMLTSEYPLNRSFAPFNGEWRCDQKFNFEKKKKEGTQTMRA